MYIPHVVRRLSEKEWGGTETVVLNTTQHLLKKGIHSEILTTQAMDATPETCLNQVTIQRFRYFYPYWGLSAQAKDLLDRKGGNPFSPALVRYLKHQMPHLIHGHSMQRMAGMVRQAAQALRVPYVLSFHGGFFQVPKAELSQMKAPVKGRLHYGRFLDPWLGYHRAIQDASGLICVNPDEYEAMQAQYPHQRVIYLPNGVHLDTPEVHQACGTRFRQQHGIPAEMPLVLCVGRIDPQKGQHEVIAYLKDNPQIGYVCIGPITDPGYAARLVQEIEHQGLANRVWILPGTAPESQLLADARAAAQVCVVPSRHEPFGIVVLEAWRQKLPVVAHAVGGLKTLITPHQNGALTSPGADFLQELHAQLTHTDYASKLGKNGYNTIKAQYTWETVTTQLLEFYTACQQDFIQKKKGTSDAHTH